MSPCCPDEKHYLPVARLVDDESGHDEFHNHRVSFREELGADAERGIVARDDDDDDTPIDITNQLETTVLGRSRAKCVLALLASCAVVLAAGKGLALHCGRRHQFRGSSAVSSSLAAPASNDSTETPTSTVISPARAYDVWTKPFPCFPFDRSYNEGLFYAKVPKTASSTLSGIGLRIAHRKGRELNISQQQREQQQTKHHSEHWKSHHESLCNVEVKHGDVAEEFHYGLRNRERSFLWSFVRDPTEHALSHYYYTYVSRSAHEVKEDSFKKVSNANKYMDTS